MLFLVFIVLCGFSVFSSAGDLYEIVFEEGIYGQDSSRSVQYLAKVSLKVNGELKLVVRGSTIPDSALYDQFVNSLGSERGITDKEIEELEPHVKVEHEKNIKSLLNIYGPIVSNTLSMFSDVVMASSRVPILWSGSYAFSMGIHDQKRCYTFFGGQMQQRLDKKGNPVCPLGHPYVPRVMGGPYLNQPYDGRVNLPNERRWCVGCFVVSIIKNNAQDQARVANGINIHNGLAKANYRGSEGCLTIAPGDWERFWKALPSPEEWDRANHKGVVTILRRGSPKPLPSPPGNIQVQQI